MPDTQENLQQQTEHTVLIAQIVVHLESGESFELLPFEDRNDVKSQVSDLLEDWSKSGFLIRGSRIYPWHQVKLIEAAEVAELSEHDARLRVEQWRALDDARHQQTFWKTKKEREKKQDEQDSERPHQPAHGSE